MTPKQWIKKYCKTDVVICDGMTENLNFFEQIFLPLGVAGVIFISYLSLKIYQFIRKNR